MKSSHVIMMLLVGLGAYVGVTYYRTGSFGHIGRTTSAITGVVPRSFADFIPASWRGWDNFEERADHVAQHHSPARPQGYGASPYPYAPPQFYFMPYPPDRYRPRDAGPDDVYRGGPLDRRGDYSRRGYGTPRNWAPPMPPDDADGGWEFRSWHGRRPDSDDDVDVGTSYGHRGCDDKSTTDPAGDIAVPLKSTGGAR